MRLLQEKSQKELRRERLVDAFRGSAVDPRLLDLLSGIESQNRSIMRRQRIVGLGIIVCACVLIIYGAVATFHGEVASILRAGAYRLLDRNGEIRGTWDVNADKTVITLRSKGNRDRIWIAAGKDESEIVFEDGKGRARVGLFALGDQVGLILYDAEQKTRAELKVDKTGPRLQLRDQDGKVVFAKP